MKSTTSFFFKAIEYSLSRAASCVAWLVLFKRQTDATVRVCAASVITDARFGQKQTCAAREPILE
jgi:hypothetical protein